MILLVLQVWGSYRTIASVFKWLTIVFFAYIGAAFFAHPHWNDVLRGTFMPNISFNAEYVTTLVAILGTTISPYMIFWQANQEVEENIALGRRLLRLRRGVTSTELRYAAIDVSCGMFFSNLVMYFIILATASTLFVSGHRHITTTTDAAKALVPFAGAGAEWLLAAGMIGSGILAVPILTTSAAYALAEAFGWKEGLSLTTKQAPQFYTIIATLTTIGACLNFIGFGTIAALYWSAVLNGVLAPVLLFAMMLVANNKHVMKKETNGPLLNAAGWVTVAVMGAAALGLATPLFFK
jgi:Mn2+/Fe2+ NRAMP family transporter